jgi:hypothetical protein
LRFTHGRFLDRNVGDFRLRHCSISKSAAARSTRRRTEDEYYAGEFTDAVVMALVGHESAAMSQRYTHVGKESLKKQQQHCLNSNCSSLGEVRLGSPSFVVAMMGSNQSK